MTSLRRPIVTLSALGMLVAIQAVLDPTGLLALVGWSGAQPGLAAGIWPFAPYAVFVPVLLGTAWWVARRAGDRYWTLVAGLVLAILLAQAAACLVMTWDLAHSAWAAGYVTAKAVPAALVVAAFARWFGGPSTRDLREPGSPWAVWLPAGMFAVVTPFIAGMWWTSAAFAPGVPVARPDRGAVAVLVAMLLIAGLTALCLRWMRRRIVGVLGGWLAALVAGGAAGVVQAVVAAIVDGGFRGDLWPLMTLYIAIADGLSFGACVGWLVGVGAVAAERVLAGRSVRVLRIAGATTAVAAVLVAVGLPVVGSASASASSAEARAEASVPEGFLRADGRVITDGRGNQVLLRGVNVNQLVDFYRPQAVVDDTRPLTEEDFAGIAAQGFDVVRLNLSWSALEPARGELAAAYLEQIDDAVDWAKAHDVYVVLDMHQDSWFKGATEEGTACRAGTDPMWGYDGAPAWATITDGAPRCQFQGRDISPAGDRAFQHFYFDTDGVRSALADTWGRLAERYRDEPVVAGFDLMNEPGFGETAPITTSYLLGRFYDDAIREIRAAGAPQIVFIEPSILWSGLGFDSGPPADFTADRNIAFSPHLYAESLTMDRSLGIPPIVGMERQFDLAERVADAYDAPLWSGEYGYWGDQADVDARLARYAVIEDEHRLGSAYWVWKQACGDPQNGIGPTGNGLMVQNCESGGDAPPRDDLLQILSRAYPRSAPGALTALSADGATIELAGTTEARSCGLEVWLPGDAEPEVTVAGITDLELGEVTGGWIATGCADGEYSLSAG
ncbi:glycoside hydrolase family 5 protein [Agromyces sp. MMS24-JH15]|uniref:glycoside hydrolase family 5 protein n=1 Tax=Agromyces sp. MMS24-JH15 TaxID=3243765 RepID=UPI00374939E4